MFQLSKTSIKNSILLSLFFFSRTHSRGHQFFLIHFARHYTEEMSEERQTYSSILFKLATDQDRIGIFQVEFHYEFHE